jgi:hypothetical protein
VLLKEYIMKNINCEMTVGMYIFQSQKNLKVVGAKWVLFWPSRSEFDGVEFSFKAY